MFRDVSREDDRLARLEKMVENLATSVERIGGKLAIAQQEDETEATDAGQKHSKYTSLNSGDLITLRATGTMMLP